MHHWKRYSSSWLNRGRSVERVSQVFHLLSWKMRLTWRMYTRNTLASLETLLFFLFFAAWIGLGSWVLVRITMRALEGNWMPRALIFCDLYTFIFLIWFIIPLAGYRVNEAYDLGKLKIYPLPPWKVFIANILGALTDISVLMPLSGFIAIFLATQPSPDQILPGILMILALLVLLIVAGLTLVNALYILLPRLNLVSVGMVILAGILLWALLLNLGLATHPAMSFNYYVLFRPQGIEFFRPYPAGEIGIAIDTMMDGRWEEMKVSLRQFGIWTAGVFFLNFILVAYLWESDPAAKSSGKFTPKADLVTIVLSGIERILAPVFGNESAALYKKDMLEFATRSPYFLLYKILPGSIAPMIILLAMRWNLEYYIQFSYRPEFGPTIQLMAFVIVIFIVVSQANLFAGNIFGFESENIRSIFVMPTPRRHILVGKNLFLGGLFLIDSLVLSFLVLLYYPTPIAFFTWLTLTLTLFLIILSIGNYTSSIWPYWMPLDKPSFSMRTTIILSLVNMGAILALAIAFSIPAAMVILPWRMGNEVLSFIMMPLALLYGLMFHRLTLGPAVNLLESNEFLLLRRIADQEEL